MNKVGAEVLCRFEEVVALKVAAGNVNVGSLPIISVRYREGLG